MRIFTGVAIGAVAAALAMPMLTACGSNGGVGGNESAAQQTDGPVTLNYWTWYPRARTSTRRPSAPTVSGMRRPPQSSSSSSR
ncbi:hypothetical protein MRBLWH7_000206 [Microbacterium sp. LWH7-1.2]|jgi:hypothetical protein|uniref:hypothetical protein n=1 Tax=Microbacterium sp. LWH7-1.2 TaxID=3135257 RepID=UPI003138FAD5